MLCGQCKETDCWGFAYVIVATPGLTLFLAPLNTTAYSSPSVSCPPLLLLQSLPSFRQCNEPINLSVLVKKRMAQCEYICCSFGRVVKEQTITIPCGVSTHTRDSIPNHSTIEEKWSQKGHEKHEFAILTHTVFHYTSACPSAAELTGILPQSTKVVQLVATQGLTSALSSLLLFIQNRKKEAFTAVDMNFLQWE